jgi:hypothetical protein
MFLQQQKFSAEDYTCLFPLLEAIQLSLGFVKNDCCSVSAGYPFDLVYIRVRCTLPLRQWQITISRLLVTEKFEVLELVLLR